YGGVGKGAEHDYVDPALQVVGDVAQFLPGIKTACGLVDEERDSAQARNSRFKRQARAQGRLFEEHDQLLAGERAAKVGRTRLHVRRKVQYHLDLLRR